MPWRDGCVDGLFSDAGRLLALGNSDASGTLAGVGISLAQSATAASVTGTTVETTLASVTVPGGLLGPSGVLVVSTLWSFTGSTNAKTFRNRFGSGFDLAASRQISSAPAISMQMQRMMFCRGLTSQLAFSAWADSGTNGSAATTGANNTAVDQLLTITAQLALGTETITLEAWQVVAYPG